MAQSGETTPMVDGQPVAVMPNGAGQGATLPMQGNSAPTASGVPQGPSTASGVSGKVFIVLVAVIIALIIVVLLLVLKPFGQSEEAGSSSSTQPASLSATSITPQSAESSASQGSSQPASDTPSDATPAADVSGGQAQAGSEETRGLQSDTNTYEREDLYYNAPFWGVWIGGFTELGDAQTCSSQAQAKGLPATIYETTDWDNLNADHYWVVSVGSSSTQAEAEQLRSRALAAGYSDAYVKYSGNHR